MSMCLFHFHLTINSAASITDQALVWRVTVEFKEGL